MGEPSAEVHARGMAINNNRGAGLDEVLKRLYGDGMDVSLPEARSNP